MRTLVSLLLGLVPVVATAQTFRSPEYGVAIDPPRGWRFVEAASSATLDLCVQASDPRPIPQAQILLMRGRVPARGTAAQVRDALMAGMRGRANLKKGATVLPAGNAPWFSYTHAYPRTKLVYEVRLHYFVRNGRAYAVQTTVATNADAAILAAVAASLRSLRFPPIDAAAARMARLAMRLGAELPRATSWAQAAQRARAEGRLVMLLVEAYRGLPLRSYGDAVLADPDLAALVAERFVVLRWPDLAIASPLRAPDRFGMGQHTFGRGVVIANAEGSVLAQTSSVESTHVYELACSVLPRSSEGDGPPLVRAERLVRRGELTRAAALIAEDASAAGWRLRARIARLRRRGPAALAALERALTATGPGLLRDALEIDRARVWMLSGEPGRAERALASVVAGGGERATEAQYWLGLARWRARRYQAAMTTWRAIGGEGAWAVRAAAAVKLRGANAGTLPAWADERAYAALRAPASAPVDAEASAAARAADEAVRFLLREQRDDGSFWAPEAAMGGAGSVPMRTAIAAIAGSALLPRRADARVDRAVAHALSYVLERVEGRELAGAGGAFDHKPWAQVFGLRFLAECRLAGVGQTARVDAGLRRAVALLAGRQLPSGGWSYIGRGQMSGMQQQSIGFVTAAALLALRDARRAGVPVPSAMIARAEACVAGLATPRSAWRYMTKMPDKGAAADVEAAGRSPLYALALLPCGKATRDDLRAALRLQRESLPTLLKETGKALCHTGVRGNASYYLLYGMAFAAEALAALPAAERAETRAALVAGVLQTRRADGSFMDHPMPGRVYGTAMALRTLDRLGVRSR